MSLEGTLETIALPDVLALLSVTAKTGELRIESRGGVGSVWFDAGRLAGFDVGAHTTAVDSLFGLLRLDEGHFKFYTGTSPLHAVEPQEVAPALEEAESRLVQWAGIVAAVPSMYSQLSLQGSAEGARCLERRPVATGRHHRRWQVRRRRPRERGVLASSTVVRPSRNWWTFVWSTSTAPMYLLHHNFSPPWLSARPSRSLSTARSTASSSQTTSRT